VWLKRGNNYIGGELTLPPPPHSAVSSVNRAVQHGNCFDANHTSTSSFTDRGQIKRLTSEKVSFLVLIAYKSYPIQLVCSMSNSRLSKNMQTANLYSYCGCINLVVCDMLLQKQRQQNGFMLLNGYRKLELWKIIISLREFAISFNELNIVNTIHCYFCLLLRVISAGYNICTADRQVVWSCLICTSYSLRFGFSTTDAETIDNKKRVYEKWALNNIFVMVL
jgi:hypothetical protein